MRMLLILLTIFFMLSCQRKIASPVQDRIIEQADTKKGVKYCGPNNRIIKPIDTTKEHWVESSCCIKSIKTNLESTQSVVVINAIDALTGKRVKVGEAMFFGPEEKEVCFTDGKYSQALKSGKYAIYVYATRRWKAIVEDLKVEEGKIIEMNFYLGSSLQF